MADEPTKSPWRIYAEAFLARMGASDKKLSPQQELAEKAFLLKGDNYAAFLPRGRGVRNPAALTGSPTFIILNKRFPGNPTYVDRGIDMQTARAISRGQKRDKVKGYALVGKWEEVCHHVNGEFETRYRALAKANKGDPNSTHDYGLWDKPERGTIKWWQAMGARIQQGKGAQPAGEPE